MNGRRLEPIFLNDTGIGLELNTNLTSPPKVMLDIVCRDLANRTLTEGLLEMQPGSFVRFMGLLCARIGGLE